MNMSRRDFLRLSALVALETAALSTALPHSAMAAMAPARTEQDELAFLPIHEQIHRFKAGTLSPLDVLEAQIARIAKYNGPMNVAVEEIEDFMNFNGMINAVAFEHFDEARSAARAAEQRYRAGTARSLEGITVAAKDENDVKGWKVSMGAVALRNAPPCEKNAAIIDFLLGEGAILHIQTTVPELYLHSQTWSRLWGVTRNPWNLHYAVGGSSGGSGAALAAGFTTLATGSDMGGSIRIPASLCGVYGFKPPFGRIPTSDISFETHGPMARTFGDLVLMQNAMTGPHASVHASLRPKLEYPQTYESLKGAKIALDYFGDWLEGGIEEPVRKALDDAADVLRGQGAIVEEVGLGWKCDDIYDIFFNGLLSTSMGEMLLAAKDFESKTSYVELFLSRMGTKGPAEMALSDGLAARLHAQVQEKIFGAGYRALLMPTLLTNNYPADNDPATDFLYINGKPAKPMPAGPTFIWNLLSRYPVLDVPVGIADNNVPVGMQVVGNSFDDLAAFQVGYWYSQGGTHLYRNEMFPDYRNKA